MYITAIEASRRIGVGERTIRLWITQGKLKAEKIAVNRLAIDEREVDKIAKNRSRYRDGRQDRQERYESDVYERIEELDKQVSELGKQVALLNDRIAEIERVRVTEKVESVPESVPVVSAAVSGDGLPVGCIYARDFARQHGVAESSFRRHVSVGMSGDVVETEKTSKSRYLTPAQQEAALKFWDRHGVKHTS